MICAGNGDDGENGITQRNRETESNIDFLRCSVPLCDAVPSVPSVTSKTQKSNCALKRNSRAVMTLVGVGQVALNVGL